MLFTGTYTLMMHDELFMIDVHTVTKNYASTVTIEDIEITDEEKMDKYHVDMMEIYENKIKEQEKLIRMIDLKIKYFKKDITMFTEILKRLKDEQMRAEKIRKSAELYQRLICVSTKYIKREYREHRQWLTDDDKFELRTYFINRYNFRFRYRKPFIY